MQVKPNENYRQAWNYNQALDKNKVYEATIATNQPNYEERGLIFVEDFLLEKGEYTVVEISG